MLTVRSKRCKRNLEYLPENYQKRREVVERDLQFHTFHLRSHRVLRLRRERLSCILSELGCCVVQVNQLYSMPWWRRMTVTVTSVTDRVLEYEQCLTPTSNHCLIHSTASVLFHGQPIRSQKLEQTILSRTFLPNPNFHFYHYSIMVTDY